MKKRSRITRRDFLKYSSLAAFGGAGLKTKPPWSSTPPAGETGVAQATGRVEVVLVRDKRVLDANGRPKTEVVSEMLDTAVKELTGKTDVAAAWQAVIKPDDIVGIKTNVWAYIPTTSQVEAALKRAVISAGVRESSIGIDDRGVLRNPIFQRATALINARPMRSHH